MQTSRFVIQLRITRSVKGLDLALLLVIYTKYAWLYLYFNGFYDNVLFNFGSRFLFLFAFVVHPRLGFDGLAATLTPISIVSATSNVSAAGQPATAAAPGKVLTGDLDSSLASLAQNLSINKGGQQQVKLVFSLEIVTPRFAGNVKCQYDF